MGVGQNPGASGRIPSPVHIKHTKQPQQETMVDGGNFPHQWDHFGGVLVGGWATPLKNMNVNWDDQQPNIWENTKWQPNHQADKNWTFSESEAVLF